MLERSCSTGARVPDHAWMACGGSLSRPRGASGVLAKLLARVGWVVLCACPGVGGDVPGPWPGHRHARITQRRRVGELQPELYFLAVGGQFHELVKRTQNRRRASRSHSGGAPGHAHPVGNARRARTSLVASPCSHAALEVGGVSVRNFLALRPDVCSVASVVPVAAFAPLSCRRSASLSSAGSAPSRNRGKPAGSGTPAGHAHASQREAAKAGRGRGLRWRWRRDTVFPGDPMRGRAAQGHGSPAAPLLRERLNQCGEG